MNAGASKTPDGTRRFFGWKAALLVLLSAAAYANILNNELFLDDLDYIVNNAYLRDWHYFPRLFTENLTAGAGKVGDYYRPAILAVFSAGYHLWQLNPMGYHLLSVAFHAACALFLYRLLAGLAGPALAFWTAVFFALHPVQTEAVASASALGILMGCFLGLAALQCHLHLRRDRPEGGAALLWRLGAYAAAAVSLLCKETMVVLPGYVFLLEFCFLSKEEKPALRFRESLLQALPYLAISLAYIGLRFTVLNFGGTGNLYRAENVFTQSMAARFYTFLTVLVEFFKLMVWPVPLFMERATVMPVFLSLWYAQVLRGLLLLSGLLGAAVYWGWRSGPRPVPGEPSARALVPFGILWFLFGMVPVSNVLIPISTTMVESWLYMPMAGIAVVFLLGLEKAAGRFKPEISGRVLPVLLSILAAACLLRTWSQNRVWKDPVTFYEHTLRYAPESGRFRNNLAMAYAERKQFAQAVEQYQAAIRVNDQYPETHHNLANTYQSMGMPREAELEFRRAIQMNPRFFHSYLSLAALYAQHGNPEYARMVLEQLIANAPERWEGYYNLGLLNWLKGDRAKALAFWQEGLKADPYNQQLKAALQNAR